MVDRYTVYGYGQELAKEEDGEYVVWEDYESLEKKYNRLVEKHRNLKQAHKILEDRHMDIKARAIKEQDRIVSLFLVREKPSYTSCSMSEQDWIECQKEGLRNNIPNEFISVVDLGEGSYGLKVELLKPEEKR